MDILIYINVKKLNFNIKRLQYFCKTSQFDDRILN